MKKGLGKQKKKSRKDWDRFVNWMKVHLTRHAARMQRTSGVDPTQRYKSGVPIMNTHFSPTLSTPPSRSFQISHDPRKPFLFFFSFTLSLQTYTANPNFSFVSCRSLRCCSSSAPADLAEIRKGRFLKP